MLVDMSNAAMFLTLAVLLSSLISSASSQQDNSDGCVMGRWSSWINLGNGFPCRSRRFRDITTQPANVTCPDTQEDRDCDNSDGCVMGRWSSWINLGNGFPCRSRRFRDITTQPANVTCPDTQEDRDCDSDQLSLHTCIASTVVDCQYTAWESWMRWTLDAGQPCFGIRSHTVISPTDGSCTDTTDIQECVDCKWTVWSSWVTLSTSPCQHQRSRTHDPPVTGVGLACDGDAIQVDDCAPIDVDCVVDQWTIWVLVQNPCLWVRVRTVMVQQVANGAACPIVFDQKPCACVYRTWSIWAKQSGLFDCTGIRTRTVDTDASPGSCPDTVDTHSCVDCTVSDWSTQGRRQLEADGTCVQSRSRSIITQPEFGGDLCPELTEKGPCALVDCTVHTWGRWIRFQNPCQWIKLRSVIIPIGLTSDDCPRGYESKPCVCTYTAWSRWVRQTGTNCLAVRIRASDSSASLSSCSETVETKQCVDCVVDQWSPWIVIQLFSSCIERRTRFITTNPDDDGNACPHLTENRPCGECMYDTWLAWSRSAGYICVAVRTRSVLVDPIGVNCNDRTETKSCVDCEWIPWTPWVDISVNPCRQRRTRAQNVAASDIGLPCTGAAFEEKNCVGRCHYSTWSPWSRSAGFICIVVRVRAVTLQPDAVQCNDLTATEACVDCEWSSWTTWTIISSNPCRRQITRFHNVPAADVRFSCLGDPVQEENCADLVECQYSNWLPWSRAFGATACVAERVRSVTLQPEGALCNDRSDTGICVDCVWSNWTDWIIISTNPCRQERTRFHNPPASGVGLSCVGDTAEEADCAAKCQYGTWSVWMRTSGRPCVTERTRSVLLTPQSEVCEAIRETETCGDLNCVWGDWSVWKVISLTPVCLTRRMRDRVTVELGEGLPCPGEAVEFTPCPVGRCEYSDWTEWFRLPSEHCLGQRERIAIFAPPGEDCDALSEQLPCVDCAWGRWAPWQQISQNPCRERRTRSHLPPASGVGLACRATTVQEDICLPCPQPVDMVIVVDTSTSVGRAKMNQMKSGLISLLGLLDFNLVHVGICYFGTTDLAVANIEPPMSQQALQDVVDASQALRGNTVVSLGLKCANRQFNMSRPDVEDYLILIMDGNPTAPPDTAAEEALAKSLIDDMNDRNIFIFTIAVGNAFEDVDVIKNWARIDEDGDKVFVHTSTFTEFRQLFTTSNFKVPCPFPCQYAEWGPWRRLFEHNDCIMLRNRIATYIPAGQKCDNLLMAIACVDCSWSSWSQWIEVNGAPCRQRRFRIESAAVIGRGKACEGDDAQERNCVCDYTKWSPWQSEFTNNVCTQRRIRDISFQPDGALICPDLEEILPCFTDCVVSTWGSWQENEPGGCVRRFRQITQEPRGDTAQSCPPLEDLKDFDGKVSDWTPWFRLPGDDCRGQRQRTPLFIPTEQLCNILTEHAPCVDCAWSRWSPWQQSNPNPCSQQRSRFHLPPASGVGLDCRSSFIQEKICFTCPRQVDIVIVVDTSISANPSKITELKAGLVALLGLLDFNFVNVGICYFGSTEQAIADIEPAVSQQGLQDLITASQSIGGSRRVSLGLECANRQFDMSQPDVEDYLLVVVDGNPTYPANTVAEKALADFMITQMKDRNKFVFSIAVGDGFEDLDAVRSWASTDDDSDPVFLHAATFTEFSQFFTTMTEFEIPCPFACQYSEWGAWIRILERDDCASLRRRSVSQIPAGQNCENILMGIACVDCRWTTWSSWIEVIPTPCKQRRFRVQSALAIGIGDQCQGNDFEDRNCFCNYTEWSEWQTDLTSVGCIERRIREIILRPETATDCPDVEETRSCDIDCVVSAWGSWQENGAGGCLSRFRQITQQPFGANAQPCPNLEEVNSFAPPIDCVVSGWMKWTGVSGQGIERRIRRILVGAENGGEACPPDLEQIRNIDVNCIVSQWTEWSTAPTSLTFTRQRFILVSPHNNGIPCPSLTDSKPVMIPIDCHIGQWEPWTREFGFTYFERSRVITRDPANGGMPCPKLFDLRSCTENQDTNNTAWSIIKNLLRVAPQDLLIIIDSSSSVNQANYQVVKNFISILLDIMCGTIGQDVNQNRIALMHFSTSAHTVLEFGQSTSLNQVKRTLQAMDKDDYTTCTGDALRHALLNVLIPSKGMRDTSVAPTHVLIVTDGCTNCGVDDLLAAADMRDVAEVFVMPIEEEKSDCFNRLLTYASLPKYSHIFPIDDFNEFANIVAVWQSIMITQNLCIP